MKNFLIRYKSILASTENSHNKTLHLTGIRGYAVLGVFGVHYLQYLPVENTFLRDLISFGRYGVIVFFVLSAFTILLSISNKKFSFKSYLIKRAFRILPVYYILILVGFILGGVAYYNNIFGVANTIETLYMHFYFLNLLDLRHINNVLGVEWTIPIEVFFYFLIPFMYFILIKKPRLIIPVVIGGFLISYLAPAVIPDLYQTNNVDLYYQFSVLKYFFTYSIGIIFFVIFSKLKGFRIKNTILWLSLMSLPLFIAFGFSKQDFLSVAFVSIWSCILILICSKRDQIGKAFFENRWIVFMGNISYSFYLIHFIFTVHDILPSGITGVGKVIVALIVSIVLATISYFVIERPFIYAGRSLARKLL